MLPNDFVFSQSSLQSYLNCPKQFELLYLKRITWPAQKYADSEIFEIDLAAGQKLHLAIQRYLLGLDEQQIYAQIDSDPDPRISIWFTNFIRHFGYLRQKESFLVENPLTVPLGEFCLTAKYDFLMLENVLTSIFDWKTSAKKPSLPQLAAKIQTKVYLLVAHIAGLFGKDSLPQMRYWEANYPQLDLTISPTLKDLSRFSEEINRLIQKIAVETEFQKTQNLTRCVYCRYRSYCQRGNIPGLAEGDAEFHEAVSDESEQVADES